MVKFIVYGGGLIALIVLAWMFRDELAQFWNGLFGKKKSKAKKGNAEAEETKPAKPLPHFSQYREPFSSGHAEKWPATQTLQYTFEALEAWARGHKNPREEDQTPHEFAAQLLNTNELISKEARRLADLFGKSMHSGGLVDRSELSALKRLWQLMIANTSPQTI